VRAVRVHDWGAAPVLEDVADPVPSAGRTIVRLAAATVGHVDRTIWSGAFLRHPPLPYVPGVEGAGTVVDGDAHAPGTRVWLRGGGLGTASDGTWAELVSAADDAVGALPEAVPFAIGSAFFSPCTSAWVALHHVGELRSGERVAVTGAAGAVGALACQLALEAGAIVRGIVGSAERAGSLPAGVEPVIVDRGAPELSQGEPVDLLVDTVGGPVLAAALASVVPGGRAVLVGYLAGHELRLDLPLAIQRDVSLLPLNMIRREAAGRAAAPELLARIAAGQLAVDVTTFPLADAGRALDWIGDPGHHGRAVLLTGEAS